MVRRFADVAELSAGAAATVRGVHVRHAHHAPAPSTRSRVRLARRARADGAIGGLADSKGAVIDMADRAVLAADELAGLIAEHDRMLIAIHATVLDALMRVPVAPLHSTRCARGDFVRREDGAGVEGAFVAMLVADEAAGCVRAPEMSGAMNALIDGAGRAVMLANGLRATSAAGYLVHSDVLAPSALALGQTLCAEATLAPRRRQRRQRRVLVADCAAADRACLHALAAGGMVALAARCLVPGAVRLVTRHARPRVLGAGRMAVDVTGGDAVVPAEVLAAHAAGQCAAVAADVTRLAHREPPDVGAVAFGTGEGPVAGAVEPSLREQRRLHSPAAHQLPLRALNEELPFGELYRVHDRPHLMPPLLLGTAARVLGFDRSPVPGAR